MTIACTVAAGVGLLVAGPAVSDDGGPYEVRAIFDNAAFLVPGEEVRIAGARVGEVAEVDVTRPGETVSLEDGPADEPGKAAVVLRIDDPGFQDFREDASCLVQPQSLLGEKFVGCRPTQPRAPGTEPPAPLEEVPDGQPGEGELLLPLENNGKAVDLDLVNNIMREPYAERFRLILNDLGAGFAARGDELEEIVERANPALRQTNRVLAILAQQNRALAELARDSDTVLAPLARERRQITDFIRGSGETAQATAERAAELEAGFELFPGYLRELRKTSAELRRFADAGTPVITDFGESAPEVNRAQRALAPLADAGTEALKTLGDATAKSEDDIVASDPVIKDVRDLARSAKPGANQLDTLMRSLDHAICVQFELLGEESRCVRTTTGFESLMDFIFGTSAATNGFDQFGHYLRTFGLVTNCTQIISTPVGGCSSKFTTSDETTTRASESEAHARKERADQSKGSRRRAGTATGSEEPERAPAPPQPPGPTAPPLEGDSQSELAPPPEAGTSRRSARAGRALLRFLMEDGS